ncbi:MAG: prolyl oligopeptidase family serine peptidase [Sedimentisphaerales bacterium]|jgi:predicted esterase|nr:prolyl oligopeptidase family serine peptidase [Sedimentisphaerales bacterium]HNY80666.1 prolyl oligopeptidase family serine peptidase [Sedimentisphaerales bacterium]HOC65491.1 prolyl oligopeptidase family serine peptidase [Sedimentisphaerales bacterium]HOH66416.1 prolyl oligopeptidase family serine peptidase [Sedimentisphaerales bacterium]HQA90934.1 prolyl oligopeptidase family serine peptidase [Sedimentisphaerales bacterium]
MRSSLVIWLYSASLLLGILFDVPTYAADEPEAFSPPFGLLLSRSETSAARGRRGFGLDAGDPIRERLVQGTLLEFAPEEGSFPEGQEGWQWKRVQFDKNGAVQDRGTCLYAPVASDVSKVLILNASGQSETYVNGVPRGGDIYNYGYVHLPVLLHEGANHLLFRGGRGSFKVRLYEPPAAVFLQEQDTTLPDLIAGQTIDTWGAVVVINATSDPAEGFTLSVDGTELSDEVTPVPTVPPLTVRKVGFRIRATAPIKGQRIEGTLRLLTRDGIPCHEMPLSLEVVQPDQRRRITFISELDDTVQYFSLLPATAGPPDNPLPAVVLSCHGAGVEAHGQAGAYSPKRWFHIVAPTNRRPYGFDWEDFGRMDAMEVLDVAQKTLAHDLSRIYLTGHSMGGHGAWHLGVTYPDRFAAVGPSAGWLSRSSYGGRRNQTTDESPMEVLLSRGQKSGDTVALAANLKQQAVYILHGGNDDNVPPAQARTMAEVLEGLHHDWVYHEEPNQGHWWGNEYNDGGSACVDWPFMFDRFARHALAPSSAIREVDFTTANPGVSSRCHWLAIEGQIRHMDLSKAHVENWPHKCLFKGVTDNVAILRLDVGHLPAREPVTVELDGQTIAGIPYPDRADSIWLERKDSRWQSVERPPLRNKGPHRYGSVKEELRHRFLLVYGTCGTVEENTWSFAKARYDTETFLYRGNASPEMVPDTAFEPSRYRDRTVVFYGNAQTNSAWSALLSDSPVQVHRDRIQLGDRTFEGDDLSAVFVRPRPDSDIASVVVIGGAGPVGMRSTYSLSLFTPFVRYPDCVIRRVDRNRAQDSRPIAAGYFGLDWSIENGEFLFSDQKGTAQR